MRRVWFDASECTGGGWFGTVPRRAGLKTQCLKRNYEITDKLKIFERPYCSKEQNGMVKTNCQEIHSE